MRVIYNPEYLRRNLLVCKAIGANANAKAALKRISAHKRPPKWLVAYLEGIVDRTEPLGPALACYRAAVPYTVPVNTETPEQILASVPGLQVQRSGEPT